MCKYCLLRDDFMPNTNANIRKVIISEKVDCTKDGCLHIVKIQRTCVHDGPGIRTTIFFRGCALRCQWCQNPESLDFSPAPGDEVYTVDEIADIVLRDQNYYVETGGGITLSGGEPLLQDAATLKSFLKILKEKKLTVTVETTLNVPWETIRAVLPYIDLFYVDFKVVGNDALHKKLTGQTSERIHSNLKKLITQNANISYRMVMVPGLNDGEEEIAAAARFLHSIGCDRIELLKYHNMYEDKAKRLNLHVPQLNITNEQSLTSLKNGVALFSKYGITPFNDDLAAAPSAAKFTDRVLRVQKAIRESERAICFEVSRLKTEYYKKYDGFEKPTPIHRAQRLRYVLKNKKTIVYPDELLVGNFTSKRVAGQVWEEQYGFLYISFLYKVNRQKPVAFHCTAEERREFYRNIFPFWIKRNIITKVNPKISDFLLLVSRMGEMNAGFNNNMAAIAHFIVNFERLLTLGTTGLKEEAAREAKEHPENNRNFYRGVIIALEALELFAERYAEHLRALSAEEMEPERKKELEKMAEICAYVPKNPARTFHEALQSMMFLQIALCVEAYENAVSFGRFDRLLYPYYKKDFEEGRITYDEAKELLCLFVLKMDEVILVNDGESFLNVSKLFETLSTDQALTFGGVDEDGNDATNDITYMLIDACELQPLAINMCARIHEKSPEKYLNRLAEIYINGCPMPELFSDNIYIDSLTKHYNTSLENARNFSIVGCVEPVASDDHFGNTDSANMNVTLPLLQALKGHEHDLWNFSKKIQIEKLSTKVLDYAFKGNKDIHESVAAEREKQLKRRYKKRGLYEYNPPADMNELLERFQKRLNALAKAILDDQQKIERVLKDNFTTPLASSLYKNCLKTGKDVYEGGAHFNTAGIQAVGITDAADSLYAIDEVVFRKKLYTLYDILEALDANFEGDKNQKIREALLAVPKFGDDSCAEPSQWVSKVMEIYNNALDSVPYTVRNGKYTAGYYALNVNDRYGKNMGALPSGRLKGVPLANSVTPHYGMESGDLLSALNSLSEVNFTDYAVNGTTVTFTVDSALFPGDKGVKNLAAIFKTFLTKGGMQFQPNIINRNLLIDAYNHPEKYKYLMVRVAGYCAYFNELSDDLKKIIINRTCYA